MSVILQRAKRSINYTFKWSNKNLRYSMKIIDIIKRPSVYFNIALRKTRGLYRIYFTSGKLIVCQVCDWKGACFYSGKCPKCNSWPRTRLVPYSINYFHLAKDEQRILHVAPNLNEYNYIRNNLSSVSKYDRLNIRKVNHINIVQDLTHTNLKSNHYDLAIAWHVLEHIPEDLKAISEVYRILKTGCHFLVSVPIYPINRLNTYEDKKIKYEDYETIHGHHDHCRSCGLDYFKRFEDIGFSVRELKVENLADFDIEHFGLSKNHVVWCFKK